MKIYNEKVQKFQRKRTVFFTTPSFSEKLLLFIFFSFHIVEKPLLIVKILFFFVLSLLKNKFCTTAETSKILAIVLYSGYRSISDIIFKQQIRKVMLKCQ